MQAIRQPSSSMSRDIDRPARVLRLHILAWYFRAIPIVLYLWHFKSSTSSVLQCRREAAHALGP